MVAAAGHNAASERKSSPMSISVQPGVAVSLICRAVFSCSWTQGQESITAQYKRLLPIIPRLEDERIGVTVRHALKHVVVGPRLGVHERHEPRRALDQREIDLHGRLVPPLGPHGAGLVSHDEVLRVTQNCESRIRPPLGVSCSRKEQEVEQGRLADAKSANAGTDCKRVAHVFGPCGRR
jgi:hypothetical protein